MKQIAKSLLLSLAFFSYAAASYGQTVFVPDVQLRTWFNNLIPGVVDGAGMLDTTNSTFQSVDLVDITVDWGPSDLTGIQYFQNATQVILNYTTTATPAIIPGIPETAGSVHILGFPGTVLPAWPTDLQILTLEQCPNVASVPDLAVTTTSLTLRDLPQLTALPSSMPGLEVLALSGLSLTALPSLPTSLQTVSLANMAALTTWAPLPASISVFDFSNSPIASIPSWPPNALSISLTQLPNLSTMPSFPASLTTIECWDLPLLMVMPDLPPSLGLVSFFGGLDQLQVLTSSSIAMEQFTVMGAPLLSAIPALPPTTYAIGLSDLPALASLPDLPPGLLDLGIADCPNLFCLPFIPNTLSSISLSNTGITCLPNPLPSGIGTVNIPFDQNLICSTLVSSCPTMFCTISGEVFHDLDSDGTFDAGEDPVPGLTMLVEPVGLILQCDTNGHYLAYVAPGNYTITLADVVENAMNVLPISHQAVFAAENETDTANDFGVELVPGVLDLRIRVFAQGWPRPGFANKVYLKVWNEGTVATDGQVVFQFDAGQSWVSSNIVPNAQTASSATWDFSALEPGQTRVFMVEFLSPTNLPLGSVISYSGEVISPGADATPADNADQDVETVVGSFDPNDKQVSPDTLTTAQVTAEERLEYTIRFQNTGTFLAERVVITDTLSTDLQWNTMQLVAASHAHEWYISYGVLHIVFDNIMLPDSNSNEPESHGFFKFSMKPVSTLLLGDQVDNTANIYFDFNEPVTTNTATMLVNNNVSVAPQDDPRLRAYPNPVGDALVLTGTGLTTGTSIVISDAMGREVLRASATGQRTQLDIAGLKSGVYTVRTGAGAMLRVVKR